MMKVALRPHIEHQIDTKLVFLSLSNASFERKAIEIKTIAFRDRLTKNTKFCKNCRAIIDEDSKFCKKCGEEQ